MRKGGFLLVTGAAVALAALFFRAGYPTPIYDGWAYYRLALHLKDAGLAAWPLPIRTYGYPLFALAATGFREVPPEEFRLLVFLAQLAAYLAVCALVARRLARIHGSPVLGLAAYALGALNPAPLLQTTEPLSDLLSAALILAAVALAWREPDAARGGVASRAVFPSFLCAGAAVAVRPANLAVLAGLAAAWALRGWRWREAGARAIAAAAAGLAIPLLPQALLRRLQTGAFLPLVESDLYRDQVAWGMRALKYGTLVVDGRPPFLLYANPLYRGAAAPADFALHDPLAYAGTLVLHGFAMLDRDLPFTYVTDVSPWYRAPVAIANLLLLALAAAGLAASLGRLAARERRAGVRAEHGEGRTPEETLAARERRAGVRAEHGEGRTPEETLARRRALDERGFVAVSVALVGAAYLAVYLPVAVEARFGVALQALAPALVVALLASLSGPRKAAVRGAVAAFAALALALGVFLSAWIARERSNPADLRAALLPPRVRPAAAPVPPTPAPVPPAPAR